MGTGGGASRYGVLDTPLGELRVCVAGDAVVSVSMPGYDAHPPPLDPEGVEDDSGVVGDALAQLSEYFGGDRRTFNLPLAPHGTEFQLRVWDALRTIPYGTTTSYAAIAESIGRPTATRAVGAANGRNPIAIIVPCHRVIGASGEMRGYGLGGVERKRRLLELEGALAPAQAPLFG